MDIKTGPAVIADVDSIMKIETSGIAHPWTRDSIEALVNDDNKIALKAFTDGGEVIGYVGASYVLDEADIGNICVLPEYRGQGAGKMLLNDLLETLKTCGIVTVFLEVESDNTNAIALYEKAGFTRYNLRKDYYGEGRDAMLYRRSL